MPDDKNTSLNNSSASTGAVSVSPDAPLEVSEDKPLPVTGFRLEKIDDNNVRKITAHPEVAIVNIPAMRQQKDELEATIGTLREQLDQINEVLVEYERIK